MCSTFRCCRLYSWMRLTWTSKSDSGHHDAGPLLDERRELALGGQLDLAPLPLELGVVGERLEPAELVQVPQPAVADALGDERGEAGLLTATKRRGVTPLVTLQNLSGHSSEVAQHRLLEQLRVQRGDAVDGGCRPSRGGPCGRSRSPPSSMSDMRASRASSPGKLRAHLVEEAAVDLVDDLQVARQEPAEQLDRPLLQRLGQQRVVRVGEGVPRDVPGLVPVQLVLVDEQPHQFGHGDRRVGVVELDGPLLVEAARAAAPAAGAARIMSCSEQVTKKYCCCRRRPCPARPRRSGRAPW